MLALVLSSCSSSRAESGANVATTIYPIDWLVGEIAGDRADVVNVSGRGANPHDVELSSHQVVDLLEADAVVYIGHGFQPAVEDSVGEAEGVTMDALDAIDSSLEEEGEHHDHVDAHFWLDPTLLASLAPEVAETLGSVDPGNGGFYQQEARDVADRLHQLDARFKKMTSDCASRRFVTGHEAFGYLAHRYDLVTEGIAGLDPEGEPSPRRIAEMIDLVEDLELQTIFYENSLSPAATETIAEETQVEAAALDSLETEPDSGDYASVMETNLETLADGLRCTG
jgi:zinc transport system substrate-binding protein